MVKLFWNITRIISSFVYKFPLEDVSVSGNFKNIRKNFLFHSSNVFSQYVLGTITCFSCPVFNLPLSFLTLETKLVSV